MNEAQKVEMRAEILHPCPAFQSEKTGSTPVGSAMILLNNFGARADVCH
jgi:hypothetical protein